MHCTKFLRRLDNVRGLKVCASVLLLAACAQLPPAEVPLAPGPRAEAVVFDVDGTLTPSVLAVSEVRPGAAQYKTGILDRYLTRGWHLAYAYGDSTTDFEAYAKTGITKSRVFALKRRGQNQCQDGVYQQCLDGWEQNIQFVKQRVPVVR